jgi:hypothetical protein
MIFSVLQNESGNFSSTGGSCALEAPIKYGLSAMCPWRQDQAEQVASSVYITRD